MGGLLLHKIAARKDVVAAKNEDRRKETHYRNSAIGTKFVFFAFETYGALSVRSNDIRSSVQH